MSTGGGLLYPGDTVEPPPEFSLYSDGHVIYSRSIRNGTATSVEMGHGRFRADQVTALLQDAMGPGGLAVARASDRDAPIFDAGTVNFEIHAGGVDKVVSVYALGFEEGVPAADVANRRALAALAERLRGVEADAAAGRIDDLGSYEPEAYLLTLDQPIHDASPSERPWPWEDLEPSFFDVTGGGDRAEIITPQQARLFWDPPTSVPVDQVLESPDGATRYLVRIRPLLPDQIP
jgi:hypothetical protein